MCDRKEASKGDGAAEHKLFCWSALALDFLCAVLLENKNGSISGLSRYKHSFSMLVFFIIE